jgi:hypothetical protein
VNGVRKQISDNAAEKKGCLNFLYVELAGKYRLTAVYFQKEFVDEGGLGSFRRDAVS